ncbi:competence protein TfoX [Campylobacter molothri]|uniref:TfoX/Sxy family protein n=1 Tax=Campylobacter molothri TaxID=1032242 RepID=UPI001DA0941F|nr:competence protein TfoX [Campylobacter sp. W0045]
MSSSENFKDFVLDQLKLCGNKYTFHARKMFGEYCIYVNNKPIFLICNDVLYIKQFYFLKRILKNNEKNFPFSKAKLWYIIDIENIEILKRVVKLFLSSDLILKDEK